MTWQEIVDAGEKAIHLPLRVEDYGEPEYSKVIDGSGITITLGLHGGDSCFSEPEIARYIVLAANSAPDMAKRMMRILELIGPMLTKCEGDLSRELLRLLGEGE